MEVLSIIEMKQVAGGGYHEEKGPETAPAPAPTPAPNPDGTLVDI